MRKQLRAIQAATTGAVLHNVKFDEAIKDLRRQALAGVAEQVVVHAVQAAVFVTFLLGGGRPVEHRPAAAPAA